LLWMSLQAVTNRAEIRISSVQGNSERTARHRNGQM